MIGKAEATSSAGQDQERGEHRVRDVERGGDGHRRSEPREHHAGRPAEHRRERARRALERDEAGRASGRSAGGGAGGPRALRPRRAPRRSRRARTRATAASRRSRTRRRAARRASASVPPPARHRRRPPSRCRPGASIAFEKSAIFTASPSLAGANELTIAPTPRLAAARLGQMRPPAALERGPPGADGAGERRHESDRRDQEPVPLGAAQRLESRGDVRAEQLRRRGHAQNEGEGRRGDEEFPARDDHDWGLRCMDPEASRRVSGETVKIRRGMPTHVASSAVSGHS